MAPESLQRVSGFQLLAASVGFVVLAPVFVVQVGSEWGQIALVLLGAGAFGFYLGHVRSGRGAGYFLACGAALGVLLWLALLIVAQIFYPEATLFPGAWFVRFGLSSALVIAASAILGDQSAQGRSAPGVTMVATLIGIAGGALTLVKGG